MSYQAEMLSWSKRRDGSEDWNTNGLYFATPEEADAYGKELSCRAIMVFKTHRVIEATEPVNYTFDWEHGAQPIKEVA
jgi:hypothetical protein